LQIKHLTIGKAINGVVALVGFVSVLSLLLLSASPALHRLLHKEADDANHECAVTLFLHGQVDCADTATSVINCSEPPASVLPSWREALLVSTDVRLLSGRDPPRPLPFSS
jgi:hypothetical protein